MVDDRPNRQLVLATLQMRANMEATSYKVCVRAKLCILADEPSGWHLVVGNPIQVSELIAKM
jgi:hypothetical protein